MEPRWTVNYNVTRKMWMVWSDMVESDAERIAALLNANGVS